MGPDTAVVARKLARPACRPCEDALLRVADELQAAYNAADETWDVLAAHYDISQLVEIIFVVGQYTMLSMVANCAGIEPEPGLQPLPEPNSPRGSSD